MAKKVTKKKATASKTSKKTKTSKLTAEKAPKSTRTVKKTAKKAAKKSIKNKAVSKKRPASAKQKPPAQRASAKTSNTVDATKTQQTVPKKIKTYLSKAELKHFRLILIDKLKEITGDVDYIENEFLKKSRQDAAGDLSSMPIHMADIGSDNYEQEFTLGLMTNERKTVQEILLALKRIEEGTYGMCEGTGEPIPKPRLEAFPWARYSVRYAEMIENGQVAESTHNDFSNGRYMSLLTEADDEEELLEQDYEEDEPYFH